MRYCDGQDRFLTKQIPDPDGDGMKWVPCDCRRRFDDVKYLTTYPHNPVGGFHYGSSFHSLIRRADH
jgi:hypothetical protein